MTEEDIVDDFLAYATEVRDPHTVYEHME